MIDRHGVVRPQRGGVLLDHGGKFEPLAHVGQDRHAKLAPAVGDHEIDGLGRDLLGRADEIAFVFAVFGIDDDNGFPGTDSSDGFFDRGILCRQ